MNVAIVQQQPYHTEIFGCFLNYCSLNNIFVDIYFDHINDNTSYIDFYKNNFNMSDLKIFNFNDILVNHNNYKKIIFTTIPSDYSFDLNDTNINIFKIINPSKIILFCHLREHYVHNVTNISGTDLIKFNDIEVIEPVFKLNHFVYNKKLSKNILILGNFYYKNKNDLLNNLEYFIKNNFTINIVSRKIINNITNDIKIYNYIHTDQLIELFYNTDYLLLLNKPNNIYHNNIMSGAVFQALSFGIPIICDLEYHQIYNYPESIVYKKSISEIIKIINNIDIDQYNYKKSIIIDYVNKKIDYNNSILDNIIKNLQ